MESNLHHSTPAPAKGGNGLRGGSFSSQSPAQLHDKAKIGNPLYLATPDTRAPNKMGSRCCHTCRKRKLICGGERPACAICVRCKRHCEGYSPIFKYSASADTPSSLSKNMAGAYSTATMNVRGNSPKLMKLPTKAQITPEHKIALGKLQLPIFVKDLLHEFNLSQNSDNVGLPPDFHPKLQNRLIDIVCRREGTLEYNDIRVGGTFEAFLESYSERNLKYEATDVEGLILAFHESVTPPARNPSSSVSDKHLALFVRLVRQLLVGSIPELASRLASLENEIMAQAILRDRDAAVSGILDRLATLEDPLYQGIIDGLSPSVLLSLKTIPSTTTPDSLELNSAPAPVKYSTRPGTPEIKGKEIGDRLIGRHIVAGQYRAEGAFIEFRGNADDAEGQVPNRSSKLRGLKVNMLGQIVNNKGVVFGWLIEGDLNEVVGKTVGDDGEILDGDGDIIGRADGFSEKGKTVDEEAVGEQCAADKGVEKPNGSSDRAIINREAAKDSVKDSARGEDTPPKGALHDVDRRWHERKNAPQAPTWDITLAHTETNVLQSGQSKATIKSLDEKNLPDKPKQGTGLTSAKNRAQEVQDDHEGSVIDVKNQVISGTSKPRIADFFDGKPLRHSSDIARPKSESEGLIGKIVGDIGEGFQEDEDATAYVILSPSKVTAVSREAAAEGSRGEATVASDYRKVAAHDDGDLPGEDNRNRTIVDGTSEVRLTEAATREVKNHIVAPSSTNNGDTFVEQHGDSAQNVLIGTASASVLLPLTLIASALSISAVTLSATQLSQVELCWFWTARLGTVTLGFGLGICLLGILIAPIKQGRHVIHFIQAIFLRSRGWWSRSKKRLVSLINDHSSSGIRRVSVCVAPFVPSMDILISSCIWIIVIITGEGPKSGSSWYVEIGWIFIPSCLCLIPWTAMLSTLTRLNSCNQEEASLVFSIPIWKNALHQAKSARTSLASTGTRSFWNLFYSTTERHIASRGKRSIYHQCHCGRVIWDNFIESRPNAASHYDKSLDQRYKDYEMNQKRIERTHAGRGSSSSQKFTVRSLASSVLTGLGDLCTVLTGKKTNESTLPQYQLDPRGHETQGSSPQVNDLLFLLLCIPRHQYATTLVQPKVSDIRSDRDFFHLLRQNYTRLRGRAKSLLYLKTLRSIKFVQFEMYKSELVDIRKQDDLPPMEKTDEYRYNPVPAEIIPPVGENHMLHLINHPTHAEEDGFVLDRIPKKLKERLLICPSRGTGLGWGIHFIEGWHISVITLVAFIVLLVGSLAFLICWSVLEHDVQGASGVAAYIVAFLGLAIGSAQAVFELT